MNNIQLFLLLLCILGLFPFETVQQSRSTTSGLYNNPNERDFKYVTKTEGVHWKSVAIVTMGVLVLALVIYGTNCLYICQITLCKKPETKYKKMDMTSQV